MGCLTVKSAQYYHFGLAADFVQEVKEGEEPVTYAQIKKKLETDFSHSETTNIIPWGYIMVDRQFMPEDERSIFFSEN